MQEVGCIQCFFDAPKQTRHQQPMAESEVKVDSTQQYFPHLHSLAPRLPQKAAAGLRLPNDVAFLTYKVCL